jgi:hypothetical protein
VIIFLEWSGGGAIRDSGDWQPQAFLRRLVAVLVGSAAGCPFLLRPPDTGKSNDGCRRSGFVLVRFSLVALPPLAGASRARLRFKAAIRSITGGGTLTARGVMGSPFILASISPRTLPYRRRASIGARPSSTRSRWTIQWYTWPHRGRPSISPTRLRNGWGKVPVRQG